MSIMRGDFELLEGGQADVSCPDCGFTYEIEDYPENCGMASVTFECTNCGYSVALRMVMYPQFSMTYAYSKGDDPKEQK